MNKKKKKKAITLIEIMIVILLIGLIGGALAFNMRGSMDKGRIFTSKQSQARIKDILELELADGRTLESFEGDNWKTLVKEHPLGGEKALIDGWKEPFIVSIDAQGKIKAFTSHCPDNES